MLKLLLDKDFKAFLRAYLFLTPDLILLSEFLRINLSLPCSQWKNVFASVFFVFGTMTGLDLQQSQLDFLKSHFPKEKSSTPAPKQCHDYTDFTFSAYLKT